MRAPQPVFRVISLLSRRAVFAPTPKMRACLNNTTTVVVARRQRVRSYVHATTFVSGRRARPGRQSPGDDGGGRLCVKTVARRRSSTPRVVLISRPPRRRRRRVSRRCGGDGYFRDRSAYFPTC